MQCLPKFQGALFIKNGKADPKIYMELKMAPNLKEKKVGEFILFHFKTYCKITILHGANIRIDV